MQDQKEVAYGKTKIFIRHPETIFSLEELREQKVYNYATSIQNFFAEKVGQGEYMYKLAMAGLNNVKGMSYEIQDRIICSGMDVSTSGK